MAADEPLNAVITAARAAGEHRGGDEGSWVDHDQHNNDDDRG